MSKAKSVGKRALSVTLTIALVLTTLITFNIGSLIGSAQSSAISVVDNGRENVYFYVPEQIYLAPDLDSYQTQDRYNFQWFVDSEIDKTNHLAEPRTGENASGNFYFYYKNASSITVSFRYLNQDLSEMTAYTSTSQSTTATNYANQNSTIKFASASTAYSAVNTRTDVARTRYTVASNTLDTTITREGLSPYLVGTATGYYIEWTVNYVDSLDGETKAVFAYTYVYKPFVQPAGAALRAENNRGTNHFGQNISWISGIHGFDTTGSYYPKSEIGTRGLVVFSSSNPQGVQLGKVGTKLYAQWADTVVANGRFGYDPDNNGSAEWLSSSATEYFTTPSFNYIDNNTDGSNTGDNAFYAIVTAPTSRIMVDTSRYTNFSQIPNLTVGMMVTDDEASEDSGAWYVADMTGKTDSLAEDKGYQKNSTSTGESYWNNYTSIIAGEGSYASPVSNAEVDEVKYNGPWIKSISSSSTSGYYNLRTSYFNHDGSGDHYGGDTIWNTTVMPVHVTVNNKQKLREAFEYATNCAASLGLRADGTTPYYNTSSSYWKNYVNLYVAAGQLLTDLDKRTNITVDGTSYTCDQLASALNTAIANVEAARLSSVAFAQFFAVEKDASGEYILKTINDASTSTEVLLEQKSYKYSNSVIFSAPDFAGYDYIGYVNGINYTAGTNLGTDYSSVITGTESQLSHRFIKTNNVSYTYLYMPADISSIVDTDDGIFNYMKTLTSGYPADIDSAAYPSYTARADVITDFNYTVEGNDVVAWSTVSNKSEQYVFLPFYVDTAASTEYRVSYDVTGTDAENVQLSFYNSNFTGGNGISTSVYSIDNSGDTFTTNGVDVGRAFVKLELSGDARNGKTIHISNICVTLADNNALYIDTTQGYSAVYSPSTSDPKTNMSYSTTGIDKFVVTTRYNTLTYDQYQFLPYYVQLKPNCTYEISYDLADIDESKIEFALYNSSFTGGNGDTMAYYKLLSSGDVITTGTNDDGIAQLRVKITDSAAGTRATVSNISIENLDSKTAITGTYNKTTALGIPVKEGYRLSGWALKSNAGGTANGTVNYTGNDRLYDYTFGPDIDIIEAQWEPATCNVIFRAEDGTVISEQNVIYGNAATAPTTVPEKFGHTFAGWDTDYSAVTKNLIIEPVYTEKDIAVTVVADDAEIFAGSQTTVSATFEPNEPEISAVEWTSSSNSIATVDANGVVTGVAEGTATITGTITYDGRTYSASTTVKVNPVEVTSVAVNTMPDKTTYYTGDTFDPTGLTLTVTYNNGTTAVVSEGITFNTVNTTYAGSKTVRATYAGKTTTFRITVIELAVTSIEVVTAPEITEYFVGDEDFDITGLKVVAHYNNGTTEELAEGDYELDGFDTSVAGTVEIMVYYEDFETSFDIIVKSFDVTGIIVKTPPTKTEYFVGETADYAGLKLTVTYSNGTTAEVTTGYTITGFDSATAGEQTLTVEYEGKTATFTVNVKAIELTSIEIATPAEKLEYFVGEDADFTGLTIKANYNNGTSNVLADGFNVTGFDSDSAGVKTITVEYEGKTVTFTVTIKAIELVSIEVATDPDKITYYVNETVDATGLALKVTYNNGTTAIISEGYALGSVDMTTTGIKTVEVTYEGKTATFAITVNALYITDVAIETTPDKTEYLIGESADYAGLTLKVTYNDGSTKTVSEGFTVDGFDSSTIGTVTLMVSYEGFYVTFDVKVLGPIDWSKVDELLEYFNSLNPGDYTNYDEIKWGFVYIFETVTLPAAKVEYKSESDQYKVDEYYNELQGYIDMLIPVVPEYEERFNVIGGASIKTQGGVNYIVGLQTSLTKAKFQSTFADYENVQLSYEMTTARYLGTGSKVIVKSASTGDVIAEYVIVIYGDIDGSATINSRDALAIANSISGTSDSLVGAQKLAANVEGSRTTINAKDEAVINAVVEGTMVIDQSTGKGVDA